MVTLDLGGMLAGTKYRGEFEERIKAAIDELKSSGSTILFIDELHTVVGAGASEGSVDASNILKPALARGEIQVVGATTLDEYRKHIEKDAAFERRFQPVTVGEPSQEEAKQILFGLRDRYEAHHKARITDEAVNAAVELSSRYIADRYLPDKAIDLMDEAGFDALYGRIHHGDAPSTAEPIIELTADMLEPAEAPPPAPEATPLGFAEALAALAGVAERTAIARVVLRYARTRVRRAVLFTVHRGMAQGWVGLGGGLAAGAAAIRLRLGTPGVLETVVRTRAHYLGPLPRTEANVRLLKAIGGGVPRNALLVPILALGRVVNVLYADGGRGAMVDADGVGELLILATRIAQSYDALVARV